jgi:hypothetical protein
MPRFISMKNFRDNAVMGKCIAETGQMIAKTPTGYAGEAVGQIVGHVTHVETKQGTNADGSPSTSFAAYGEFEAVVYSTGQVIESGCVYLPKYYAVEMQKALGTGATQSGNLLFGVEISMVPTGAMIPYSWDVKNVTGVARSRPLHDLKRLMAQRGVLRLPAPVALPDENPVGVTYDPAPVASLPAPDPVAADGEVDQFEEAVAIAENTNAGSRRLGKRHAA